MEQYDYVIYCQDSIDAFTSFILLTQHKLIKNKSIIYPDTPFTKYTPPDIENKNIIIIALPYKRNIMIDIIKKCKQLLYIDNSPRSYEFVKSYNIPDNHIFRLSQDLSCSLIIWREYVQSTNKYKVPSTFLRYINDYSTYTFNHENTIPFITALKMNYTLIPTKDNINKWIKLSESRDQVFLLFRAGLLHSTYQNYLIKQNMENILEQKFPSYEIYNLFPDNFDKIGQYNVAVFFGNACPSVPIIASKLFNNKKYDIIMFWSLDIENNIYHIELKSKKIDVYKISKLFNGVGKSYSSSFYISSKKINITNFFVND